MSNLVGKIVVTGGAGFIGSNLIPKLADHGWDVWVLDSLIEQVHSGGKWNKPDKINFLRGDVRDPKAVEQCLDRADYIIHLAAETGVGQSAYEMSRHVGVNELGTAVLLEAAAGNLQHLKGVVLASSRAVYGEGRYICQNCGIVYPEGRTAKDLSQGNWEPRCPHCSEMAKPTASVEDQPLQPASVYAVTKHNQEQLLAQFSRNFGIPAVALRFQNVYGPGQSLNNPYTGILSIFSTRIMSGNPILIYEDGQETRDFVYVGDVTDAIYLTIQKGFNGFDIFNVGTGTGTSVLEVANILVREFDIQVPVQVVGKYRFGDIRHAWANTSKINSCFGYKPEVYPVEGLRRLVDWVKDQPKSEDRYEAMEREMIDKGLLGKA